MNNWHDSSASKAKTIAWLKSRFLQILAAPCPQQTLKQKRCEIVDIGIQFLRTQSQEEQWGIFRGEVYMAAEALFKREPVLIWALDDTPKGEKHSVAALLDPEMNQFTVEIPEEAENRNKKGGRFPTVLHTLEMVVVTVHLANKLNLCARRGQQIPYPALKFVGNDGESSIAKKLAQLAQPKVILMPLTIDPGVSNVLLLQPNARGSYLNPSHIAKGYYKIMQQDGELLSDLLRHTMLLRPKSPEKGFINREIQVGVLPKEEAEQHYDLSDLGRLREWREPCQDDVAIRKVTQAEGKVFYVFTLPDPSSNPLSKPLLLVGPHDEEYEGITEKKKLRVAVIGAGVIGLTTALLAQEAGYQVTIYSDLPPSQTTSIIAGASFAPYVVPLTERVIKMVEDGWDWYAALARNTEQTGVRREMYWEVESKPIDLREKPYLHIMQDVEVHERPHVPGGYAHGIKYGTFLIDMPIYLSYLVKRFKANGGLFVQRKFHCLQELAQLNTEVVFNCTGLGARALVGDEQVIPLKGQLAIIGLRPEMKWAIKHDGFYAFPQPQTRRTILGGTTVENFDTSVEPGVTQAIVNGNKRILPDLIEADVRKSVVGLRPHRKGDVRVEAQDVGGKLIIHNYGHGGAGVTLSWGSGKLALSKW